MLKELLGGKDLGSSNGTPHNSQETIDSPLLVFGTQETCRKQGKGSERGPWRQLQEIDHRQQPWEILQIRQIWQGFVGCEGASEAGPAFCQDFTACDGVVMLACSRTWFDESVQGMLLLAEWDARSVYARC